MYLDTPLKQQKLEVGRVLLGGNRPHSVFGFQKTYLIRQLLHPVELTLPQLICQKHGTFVSWNRTLYGEGCLPFLNLHHQDVPGRITEPSLSSLP